MRSPVLPASADPSTVRIWNERAVLATLTDGLPRRAAHIAEATGLTPASVRAVLGTLTAKGWVCGLEPEQAGAMGRPARTFQRAHPDGLILGVDLGGHAVRVVVSDLFGEPQVVGEAPVASPDPFALRAALADALSPVDHSRVWMTGLAISGALDAEGRLARSLALPQLVGRRPADALADVLPGQMWTTHDTRSALWAEFMRGAARDTRDVMFVSLGRRPSLSLLLDGRLHLGAHGSAGELSLNELLPATDGYRWAVADGRDPQGDALRAAAAGDPAARAGARAFLAEITPQLAYAAGLTDPALVVIGGALAPALESALPEFVEALGSRLQVAPAVRLTELDQFATATGALLLAQQRVSAALWDHPGALPPLTRTAFEDALASSKAQREHG